MLTLVSHCIDRLNVYNSAAEFEELAGEEAGEAWKDILNLLYELLGKNSITCPQPSAVHRGWWWRDMTVIRGS